MSNCYNKVLVFAFLLIVFLMIGFAGCIQNQSQGRTVNYTEHLYVVDDSGNKTLDWITIYQMDGVFSSNNQGLQKLWAGPGSTVNGTGGINGSVGPVYPGYYMVFGACTNNSAINGDWNNSRFNPGNAGYWTILTYDDIVKLTNGDQNNTLNVTILLSNKTGKMIKS